jgi:probable poly-beta-1,6-N-acetyl-D-glucosamine export protein
MKKSYDFSVEIYRAVAIIAVVLIHSTSNTIDLPTHSLSFKTGVIIRQFINFAVPVFLFISGYLAKPIQFNTKSIIPYYKKRTARLMIPYLIWSILGIIFLQSFFDFDLKKILLHLLTGRCVGIYYFIIVLFQFTLLTPLLIRFINNRFVNCVNFLLTPLSMLVYYVLRFKFPNLLAVPWYSLLFCIWHFFYFFGIYAKQKLHPNHFRRNLKKYLFLLITFQLLSLLEAALIIKYLANPKFAVSQITISSFLTSLAFIGLIMAVKDKLRPNRILELLGSCAFGIFLSHMFILPTIQKAFSHLSLTHLQPVYFLLEAVITISVCTAAICLSRRLLGRSLSAKILGF